MFEWLRNSKFIRILTRQLASNTGKNFFFVDNLTAYSILVDQMLKFLQKSEKHFHLVEWVSMRTFLLGKNL